MNEYKKIKKLHELLVKNGIPHEYVPLMDGFQCIFYYKGERVGDFVEHFASYGLEAYGFDLDGEQGYFSPKSALKFVKKYIKRRFPGEKFVGVNIV